jgi:hypothetical protein
MLFSATQRVARIGERSELMPDEKFPHEEVERLKQLARVEDRYPDADSCEECAKARAASGDPTDLCKEHLRRVYGI